MKPDLTQLFGSMFRAIAAIESVQEFMPGYAEDTKQSIVTLGVTIMEHPDVALL